MLMIYKALDEGLYILFHTALVITLRESIVNTPVFQTRTSKHREIKQQSQSPRLGILGDRPTMFPSCSRRI